MEQHNQNHIQKQGEIGKDLPRVPIKTYKWEDVRRARRKGGYPWTYLYKEPFTDIIDPNYYKMDFRKCRSASNLTKHNSGVEIHEITTNDSQKQSKESLDNVIDGKNASSESDDHSKLNPAAIQYDEGLDLEEAESTDDISQYLDKEERGPQIIEQSNKAEKLIASPSTDKRHSRAKSEEPPKRKRKLSVESSYSRISLSKLGFMKKLKEAKNKIKVPKLSKAKSISKAEKKTKEEKENVVEAKPKKSEDKTSKPPPKPVYIHIPLKPPPGQTDEFSYLEFGEKKPSPEEKKEVQDEKVEEKKEDVSESQSNRNTEVQQLQPLESVPSINMEGDDNPNEIVAIEILKTESIDLDDTSHGYNFEGDKDGNIFIIQQNPENAPTDDVAIIILNNDEPTSSKSEDTKELKRQQSRKRAKSAEPERKRKTSIDSSYSRKSLSKLAWIQKKWKDTKFKFPRFSLSSIKNDEEKKESKKDPKKEIKLEEEKVQETKKLEKPKKDEPKYIHIPLKPPPGQSDEFSYLEFEEKRPPVESTTTVKENAQQDSLESPEPTDVQFIVLTPPSDDEILEDHIIIPDTPSSASSTFFDGKVDELKEIAKGVIDEMNKGKTLETVTEEGKEENEKVEKSSEPEKVLETRKGSKKKSKTQDVKEEGEKPQTEKAEEPEEKTEKIVVDEEDGLKSTERLSENKQADDIKLKKKVSFKRRSRDESRKDDDYEEIQIPAGEKPKEELKKDKLTILQASQSMSTDEEKTYLDDKVIKSTSLEEDYNKWSKLSDHEYEPINPPPENVSPTVHFADVDENTQNDKVIMSKASSTTSIDRKMLGDGEQEDLTAEQIQIQIEEKYFTNPQTSETRIEETKVITKTEHIEQPKKSEGPGKLQQAQQAFKTQAGKFKNKIHGMKKPKITLPTRPNMPKFKLEKPKFIQKMPDTTKINLKFNMPGKGTAKRSPKPPRQYSTESNYGEAKINYFDFSTYPRIFKKKPKKSMGSSEIKSDLDSEFTTGSLKTKKESSWQSKESDKWGGSDSVRIPLHPEDSFDNENSQTRDREDSVERRMASHMQYDPDIDIDDAYEKENQQIHSASPFSSNYNTRWDHGKFHPEPLMDNLKEREYKVTDLDSPEDETPPQNESFDTNNSKEIHSSASSLGIHRRGVVEEIDSDEFFIRPKGISQDNIQVGIYLSNEIREAFKSPVNALSDDVQKERFEITGSNQSLPETNSKKKTIKKPKRKKTPHVSQEYVAQDQDSEQEQTTLPPSRPKRKSRKNKKLKDDDIIPYQTTIHVDKDAEEVEMISMRKENLGILGDDPPDKQFYENEQMEGKDQPEIKVTDPYKDIRYGSEEDMSEMKPQAPKRRHKSLRSLSVSEHDSITGEYNFDQEYVIPSPEEPPPIKPPRSLSRSRSSLQSYEKNEEAPKRPARTRSGTRSLSRTTSQLDPFDEQTSRDGDSLAYLDREEPCIEEPCITKTVDYMGYAVVEKDKKREPPLPPRRRSLQSTSSETKFFTVPRQPTERILPVRPLRNYSTLGPSRPPRRKRFADMTDEEKENIDITQYIEIEEEHNRDLQSGEVLQKMRDRPLPAPPRPPRKTRPLHDITSHENLTDIDKQEEEQQKIEETVSTQTEPLPDDFVCEEVTQEATDRIITPSPRPDNITIERRFIPPSHYTSHEETVTHAALVVQPLDGAQILPDSQLTKPMIHNISITKDYDDDDEETSEIPEDFKKLKSPEQGPKIIERIIEGPVTVKSSDSGSTVELLKAQKLQVSNLDVDRLNVNELMASKIVVSEIDSGNILTGEINARTGALKIGEIELPPSVVQQLFERLQSTAAQDPGEISSQVEEESKSEQKKTPIEQIIDEDQLINEVNEILENTIDTTPLVPCETYLTNHVQEPQPESQSEPELKQTDSLKMEDLKENPPTPPIRMDSSNKLDETTPKRPPRQEKPIKVDNPLKEEEEKPQSPLEPEVDDEPPPRPPQPIDLDYLPSQPPASFYALRAQQYVDNLHGDIPTVPRRRRHHQKQLPISRSSSEDDSPVSGPLLSNSRRRYRTPEPTIPQLACQLVRACSVAGNNVIKRLILHITNNVLRNSDGQQDAHVIVCTLLVLIAGLILLGRNENVVHHHHWEYFNPPRDL